MHYNVFTPVENAFQSAGIIFKCAGNVSQCVGNVHQRSEQPIANFINVLRLTIDCFVCHANRRPSILRKTNETLLQILGLCVSPNFRYSSKCFAEIYRSVKFTDPLSMHCNVFSRHNAFALTFLMPGFRK